MIPARRLFVVFGLVAIALAVAPVVPALTIPAILADIMVLVVAWWDWRLAAGLELEAKRTWPTLLTQGHPAEIMLNLMNPGKHKVRLILRESLHPALAFGPESCSMEIRPGENQCWLVPIEPRRRGAHEVGPLVARVVGPLGLAWSQRELLAEEIVRVYPQMRWEGRVGRLLTLAHQHQLGQVPIQRLGTGGEPYALREYLPGDPLHLIHWKATARHGRPVTREETLEAQGRLVILVDCGRSMTSTGTGRSKLDHALASALALARVASSRGDRTTIAAFADRPLRTVRVKSGSRGLADAYSRLYDLEATMAEPAYDLFPEIVNPLESRRATIVVFTSVTDLATAELLTNSMLALSLRHRPLLINLEDPELRGLAENTPNTGVEVFTKVAALEILLENRRIGERLRRRGVRAVTAPANQLAIETLNAYLEIIAVTKRREFRASPHPETALLGNLGVSL